MLKFWKKDNISREKNYLYLVFFFKRNRGVLIWYEIVMDNVIGIFLCKEVEELRK